MLPASIFSALDVLGEAAAPVADAGAQEGGADPLVEAHAAGDLADVGADLLADVGDLVDEGDLGRQEGVGGELDHLGAGDVGAEELAAERLVERGDRGRRLLVAGIGADHDPVGLHEVGHRRALLEELGTGDVGEPGQVAADRLAGPGRDRALHDQHVVAALRQLLDHGADPREVGVAGVGRRRVDADEEQPGRPSSSDMSVVKVRRSALRRTRSARPGSWIVTSPRASESTFSWRMSRAIDRVAELGEAGGGHQAHPADSDHPYRLAPLAHSLFLLFSCFWSWE